MKIWVIVLFLLTISRSYGQEKPDVPFADMPKFWERVETVFLDSSVAAVNSELQTKRFVVIVRDTEQWQSAERVLFGSRRLMIVIDPRVEDTRVLVTIPSCFPEDHSMATRCDRCRNDPGFDAMVELVPRRSIFPETFDSDPSDFSPSSSSEYEWKVETDEYGTHHMRLVPRER